MPETPPARPVDEEEPEAAAEGGGWRQMMADDGWSDAELEAEFAVSDAEEEVDEETGVDDFFG